MPGDTYSSEDWDRYTLPGDEDFIGLELICDLGSIMLAERIRSPYSVTSNSADMAHSHWVAVI
jgi:hypothetical protein